MNELKGVESLLVEMLGIAFLAYVLNASEEAVISRLGQGELLNESQEEALCQLLQFIKTTVIPLNNSSSPRNFDLDVFASQAKGTTLSCVNAFRVCAGGEVQVPLGRDKILEVLNEWATSLYALFLVPRDRMDPDPFAFFGSAIHRQSRSEELEKAILADKALVKLFKYEDLGKSAVEIRTFLNFNVGGGGSESLALMPDKLLKNAWRLALLDASQPTIEDFCKAIEKTVDTLRAAADGEEATVPMRIAFTGVRLPDGVSSIELPWGTLRSATSRDDNFTPPAFGGRAISTTSSDGKPIMIKYSGDVILEIDVPYRVFVSDWSKVRVSSGAVIQLPKDFTIHLEELQKRIEAVGIGLTFAMNRKKDRPRTIPTWRIEIAPLGFGHLASWRDPETLPLLVPAQLTEDEVCDWGKWINLVDAEHDRSIEIAIHRLLMAETERKDPSDVVIDAVIAWESLVGSQSETTFRVTAALAWLLGKDSADRVKLQRNYSEIYESRSRLVHGNRVLTPKEISEYPRKAVEVTLDALRKMFESRPELLQCTSKERSMRLLLDS